MYFEIETLVDFYHWAVKEAKELSVRERRHWFKRIKAKLEK